MPGENAASESLAPVSLPARYSITIPGQAPTEHTTIMRQADVVALGRNTVMLRISSLADADMDALQHHERRLHLRLVLESEPLQLDASLALQKTMLDGSRLLRLDITGGEPESLARIDAYVKARTPEAPREFGAMVASARRRVRLRNTVLIGAMAVLLGIGLFWFIETLATSSFALPYRYLFGGGDSSPLSGISAEDREALQAAINRGDEDALKEQLRRQLSPEDYEALKNQVKDRIQDMPQSERDALKEQAKRAQDAAK